MKNAPEESSYSFVSVKDQFNNVKEDALVKAVRVTTTVSKKIANVFAKNFTIAGVESKQVDAINSQLNQMPTTTTEDSTTDTTTSGGTSFVISKTVDESVENLVALAKKLEALETQKKVLVVVKRMALYTKELVELVKRATKRWFGLIPSNEKVEEPVAAVEAVATKEDVIPFDWNNIIPKAPEVVAPVVPVVEETKEIAPVMETPKVEEKPTVEFNYDFGIPATPVVEQPKQEFSVPQFSSEDTNVQAIENSFVPSFEPEAVEDRAPSNNAIMARIHMINNSIGTLHGEIAKKEEIAKGLNTKIESLSKEIEAYKTVNKDLSDRISILITQIDALAKDKTAKAKLIEEMKANYEKTIASMNSEFEEKLRRVEIDRDSLVKVHEQEVASLKNEAKVREEKVKAEFIASMKSVYDGMQNIAEAVKTPKQVERPEYEEAYDMYKGLAKAA